MKVEIEYERANNIVTIMGDKGDYLASFTPVLSRSNCKLMTLENAYSLWNYNMTDDLRKEAIEAIKKGFGNRNILMTFASYHAKERWEWICKNYECYYAAVVPCGYDQGYQYHVLVKNHKDKRKPIAMGKEANVSTIIPKDKVVDIINDAYRQTISKKKRIELISEAVSSFKE